jgi:hypothetical protein
MLILSSTFFAVVLNALLAGTMALTPPRTAGKTVFAVSLFIIGSVLTGLLWHWFAGDRFRHQFGLDREYRRIDDDTLAELDRAEQQQFRLYRVLFGLLFLIGVPVAAGLVVVEYVQGSCNSVWECLQHPLLFGNWFWGLFGVTALVELIETYFIKPRRPPSAASS